MRGLDRPALALARADLLLQRRCVPGRFREAASRK